MYTCTLRSEMESIHTKLSRMKGRGSREFIVEELKNKKIDNLTVFF